MTSRCFRSLCLGLLLTLSITNAAHAQRFFDLRAEDFSLWSRLGSALHDTQPVSGGDAHSLRLTLQTIGDSVGAAYSSYAPVIDVNRSFDVDFFFYMTPGAVFAGDGMTFILTSDEPALGFGGSDMGYGGAPLSGYAFAIDTFSFGSPIAPSIQILENGDAGSPLATVETGIPSMTEPNFFVWSATVHYEPSGNDDLTGELTGTIHQTLGDLSFSVSSPVDFNGIGGVVRDAETEAYVGHRLRFGFSAANGLADDGHTVLSIVPTPEPGLGALCAAGTAGVAMLARRDRTKRRRIEPGDRASA